MFMNTRETLLVGSVNSNDDHALGYIMQGVQVTVCLLLIVSVSLKIPCVQANC